MNQVKECLQCTTSFTAPRKTSKYCSMSCSNKYRYEKGKSSGYWVKSQYKAYAKRVYGLSLDDIEEMNKAQNYMCALCDIHISDLTGKKKKLCVDHDHVTGKVRGLLCESCNTVLGMAKDNTETLNRAVAYIERNKA